MLFQKTKIIVNMIFQKTKNISNVFDIIFITENKSSNQKKKTLYITY